MKQFGLILVLSLFAGFAGASGLPPEHEAERLLLALKESVENKDWIGADNQLSAMRSLDVKQPQASFYYEGLVKVRSGEFHSARLILEKYVVDVGSQGEYYKDALRLITEAESAENRMAESSVPENRAIELVDSSERDGYIKSLQALYLTQDPIEALTMQVNSLLSAHPYTGSRVKKSGVKEGVVYQVNVVQGSLTLQEKSYQKGAPMLSVSSIQVSGMDPFLTASCSHREYACWLSHPSDKHKTWIKIDFDEMVVEQLREAMTKLLQSLQKEV